MVEVYKITHNIYDHESTKFLLKFAVGPTRSNGFKIVKQHTNTTACQHFFSNRVVNYWNGLPHHVVNVDSVNSFKNALDCHHSKLMFQKRVDHDVVQSLRAWMFRVGTRKSLWVNPLVNYTVYQLFATINNTRNINQDFEVMWLLQKIICHIHKLF